MTDVICDTRKCLYWRNGLCTQSSLELSYGKCVDYADDPYTDGEDYQTEYFKSRVDGKRCRAHGKRIIINGEEFFTEDDDRNDDSFVRLTHARTGVYAGSIERVKERWEEILERAAKYPDVTALPLKEGDEDENTDSV